MKVMQRNRNNTIPEESASSTIAALSLYLCDTMGLTFTAAQKIIAVTLLAGGDHPAEAAEKASLSKPECYKLQEQLKEKPDAIAPLLEIDKGRGRKSPLEDEGIKADIIRELREKNYSSIDDIVAYAKEKHNVKVSPECMSAFLAANGFRKLKAGSFPKKADTDAQKKFYNDVLSFHMEKARSGEEALLFMDAAHFVHGCDFLGYFYCETRRFIRTFSGRQRRNVLGAIDFVTKELVTYTNEDYINKESVIELLGKIKEAYGDRKVFLVLDNARYQVCKPVREMAESLGIGLLFLPPYSPNLNLIERLWKFMKNKLRREFYDSFDKFKAGIDAIISETAGKYKKEIDSLIAGPVQLYSNYVKLNENTFIRPEKEDKKESDKKEKEEQEQKQG